jgi:hypothetical protein
MEVIDERAEIALFQAREARRKLEGRLTEDHFIADTTSTFLCFSWRKGTPEQQKKFQDQLTAFEQEDSVVEKIKLLEKLSLDARLERSDSQKFRTALQTVMNDANALIDILKQDPAYLEHEAEQERLRLEAERLAAQAEEERLASLSDHDFETRVSKFKERYGTSDVLDTLLDGIEGGGMAKLVANFKRIGFKYTMKSVAFGDLIGGRKAGDCSTVAGVMAAIGNEILLVKSRVASCQDMLADTNAKTIDSGKEPNGYQNAFWVLQNHFWVESASGNYDPLFGAALDQSAWNMRQSTRDDLALNLTVEDFGGRYKVVYLMSAGGLERMIGGSIKSSDWETHCEKMHVSDVTFEQFKEAVGI